MQFQWNIFMAVLAAGLIVGAAGFLFIYLNPSHDESYEPSRPVSGEAFSKNLDPGGDHDLVQAIRSLEMNIIELNRTLGNLGASQGEEDTERIRIEHEGRRLETLIEELIQVIRGSALSSERNTQLREQYLGLANMEPTNPKNFWQSDKAAKDELFMMTYSQILEKLGPPELVTGDGGLSVRWEYPDGCVVIFVDGLLARVFFY